MRNLFLETTSILSFHPNADSLNYDLNEISLNHKNRLLSLIQELETSKKVYLCTRGDSKKTLENHNNFIIHDLSKIFIVGQKSRSAIDRPANNHSPYKNDSSDIIQEIIQLVEQVNKILNLKTKDYNIKGVIPNSFIEDLPNLGNDLLAKWKIFFISFLHNYGSCETFKNYSPFISLTYGRNKYKVASKFALSKCSFDRGIVFVYSLTKNCHYYIKAKTLTNKLKKYGVQWYKDSHSEIMLLGGMYPHFLIGIFEVFKEGNAKFIINPWLYRKIINEREFDFSNGLEINQQNFHSFAEKLGYSNFFFHFVNDNTEYFSELNQYNQRSLYHF
ncbi:MAG: hypothetical protein NTX22_10220 [Ignavibacteriales bacterium]|nr:hypothetical protein [Ignavibacteriales bacterium]